MQFSYYIVLNLIAGFLAAGLAIYVWSKRNISSAYELFALLISIAWWDFGIAIEYTFTDIPNRILWSAITYPGTMASPVFFFLFIFKYTQPHIPIPQLIKWALYIIPVISCLITWHPKGRLFLWPEITMQNTGIGMVAVYKHGVWFWIEIIYSYILLVAGIIILIRSLCIFPDYYLLQTRILLIASIIPLISSLLYSFFPAFTKGVDLTSIFLTLTSVLLTLSLFNLKLLDIKPIARNIVVDQMTDGVFVIDNKNTVIDVNPIAFKYIYREYNNLPIGKSALKVFKNWPELTESIKSKNKVQIEIKTTHKPERFYNIQITPIIDIKKNILGRSIVFRDITEFKKHEDDIIHTNQELLKTIDTKNKVFKIIAHDIKNPVNNQLLLLDRIEANKGKTEESKYLDLMKQTTIKLNDLIDNLLNWARSQQNEIRLDIAMNNISRLVEKSITSVEPQAKVKNITLVNNPLKNIYALFDHTTIAIVIRNLLNNAIKFTPSGGFITLGIEKTNKDIRVIITDTGVGMSEEFINKIFKENTYISTGGTFNESGTGLGIIVCKDLVSRNGGKMWAKSLVGKGTSISFSLPLNT